VLSLPALVLILVSTSEDEITRVEDKPVGEVVPPLASPRVARQPGSPHR
jgi:hypothetical protein